MLNFEAVKDQIKPSSPEMSIIPVPDDQRVLPYYYAIGARPIKLTPEELADPAKRESRIGGFYANPQGHVKYAECILMEIPKSVQKRNIEEAAEKARRRIEAIGKTGGAATQSQNVASVHLSMHRSAQPPDDSSPSKLNITQTRGRR